MFAATFNVSPEDAEFLFQTEGRALFTTTAPIIGTLFLVCDGNNQQRVGFYAVKNGVGKVAQHFFADACADARCGEGECQQFSHRLVYRCDEGSAASC